MFVVATVAVTAIIFIIFWMKRCGAQDDGKRYPPQASALSLLIAILRGGMRVVPDHFMRSAEKLGPVISYSFGGGRVVILNGKEAITEAFLRQSEAFADRPQFWTETNILNGKLRGIIFSRYDDTFKKYHKLCLAILKEFGFGVKSVSEIRILRQVELWKEKILKLNGRPFNPKPMTVVSTFSIVSSILFGETFVTSDACHRISDALSRFTRNTDYAIELLPLLRFFSFFRRKLSIMEQCQKDAFIGIEEGIKCSMSDKSGSTFVRRFVEIQGPDYDRQDFLYIIRDLCLASTDTVTLTLVWAMVELANHPDVQNRFQRVIDEVVPKDRFPSLDDKPRLPYTLAVILEVMRRRTLLPLFIPHAAYKDAEVFGCHIPKGCLVIANAFSVHWDQKFWKDPENFRPDRFLDEKQMIIRSEYVIPFGLGKRSCLGEVLGRQEIFLFLTSLIQHFDMRPPEGQDSIKVKEIISMGVIPSDFEIRLIPRETV